MYIFIVPSSVPLKKTNWDPYNKSPPPPPPAPRLNTSTRPSASSPLPPPPNRSQSSASSAYSNASSPPPPPNRFSPSSTGGPPPVVRSTRPSIPASQSSQTAGQALFNANTKSAPPRPPVRGSQRQNFNGDEEIDWGNLTPEDKEVFFGWLDEFFERYYNVPPPRS